MDNIWVDWIMLVIQIAIFVLTVVNVRRSRALRARAETAEQKLRAITGEGV